MAFRFPAELSGGLSDNEQTYRTPKARNTGDSMGKQNIKKNETTAPIVPPPVPTEAKAEPTVTSKPTDAKEPKLTKAGLVKSLVAAMREKGLSPESVIESEWANLEKASDAARALRRKGDGTWREIQAKISHAEELLTNVKPADLFGGQGPTGPLYKGGNKLSHGAMIEGKLLGVTIVCLVSSDNDLTVTEIRPTADTDEGKALSARVNLGLGTKTGWSPSGLAKAVSKALGKDTSINGRAVFGLDSTVTTFRPADVQDVLAKLLRGAFGDATENANLVHLFNAIDGAFSSVQKVDLPSAGASEILSASKTVASAWEAFRASAQAPAVNE